VNEYSYGKTTKYYDRVINPCKLPVIIRNWYVFMAIDLYYLIFKCNYVYMMNNYHDSRGAKIELKVARFFKKNIIFE
jgi:hypothetical protein